MNSLSFRLEIAAIASACILTARMTPKLQSFRSWCKWIHCGLVAIYLVIGIAGARFFIMFCLTHKRFVEIFSGPNIFGINPSLMHALALSFAIGDMALFVAVIGLGQLRGQARTAFILLSFPCGFLYPVIMLTWLNFVSPSNLIHSTAWALPLLFLFLAGFAAIFYTYAFEFPQRTTPTELKN